jgi:DNA-binding transcriptional regulator LsrR (DeoR family)
MTISRLLKDTSDLGIFNKRAWWRSNEQSLQKAGQLGDTMASRPLERVQAAIAARRHFILRQTKSQIAEDLSLSRFKVARLIEAAIEEGIVNFVISEPADLDIELSDKVRKHYGLKSALVLKGPDQPTSALTESLGSLSAQLLEETLEDGQLLGSHGAGRWRLPLGL